MIANRKAASPVQAGTLGETASKTQSKYTTYLAFHQSLYPWIIPTGGCHD